MNKFLLPEQRQSFVINVSAFCAGVLLLALIGLVGYMIWRGSAFIWPNPIYQIEYQTPGNKMERIYGQFHSEFSKDKSAWLSVSSNAQIYQSQLILSESSVANTALAKGIAEIQLNDGRSILAKPLALKVPIDLQVVIDQFAVQMEAVQVIENQLQTLRIDDLAPLHQAIASFDRRQVASDAPARLRLENDYAVFQSQVEQLEKQRDQYQLVLEMFDGVRYNIQLAAIDKVTFPSDMSYVEKLSDAMVSFWGLLSDSPKQANTTGGVFPALFGTVVMVFVMTIIVAPFGVLAAVYLHEYAPKNGITTTIRICVSNMAAVPSIVYGVFGLGFLVYILGGKLDALFFSDVLPTPTMGTPGLFWAAVTMALLTLPVVIVATEEGLSRVPQGLRKGSYALGATKFETIWHTVLPIASPSIMTGIILAIARAAGEVAPLMLVGAVRFAPNLPIDSTFPYLHLDRQFMHLGVLIYDGAFHSQTSAKGASMMFAACSLLLLVVLILNIVAVALRTRLRRRYQ